MNNSDCCQNCIKYSKEIKVGDILFIGSDNDEKASLNCQVERIEEDKIYFEVINGRWVGSLRLTSMMLTCFHSKETWKVKFFDERVKGY